jgi:outer membrane lipopolysaccharide assembly protein LptE/RlpB
MARLRCSVRNPHAVSAFRLRKQPETPPTGEHGEVEQEQHRGPQTEETKRALTNAGTTALDQKTQHDREQHACDDPGKQNIVHIESPFSQ